MTEEPSAQPARPRAFRLAPEVTEPAPDTAAAPPGERPRAFRVDPGRGAAEAGIAITEQPDPYRGEPGDAEAEAAVELAQRRGMLDRLRPSWPGLFWSAVGGLVSLGVSLCVWRLIDDLFARVPSLGWLGLALLGVAGLALLAMAVREILGVARQRQVATLHRRIAEAHAADDGKAARRALGELDALYAARPEAAAARRELAALTREIIDGRDLLELAERKLMTALDRQARREIADAAKRVSAVTAISPRAVLDLLFVVGQIVVLIRRIAAIYSGRPGLFGFLRLARSVGAHLALTAGLAVGDSILQQVVGHGLAAKLSARLGEGLLNGMLTTRVGLSAMAVCRPMPFAALKAPSVRDVAPFLFGDRS